MTTDDPSPLDEFYDALFDEMRFEREAERIMALTPEELKAELLEAGFTEERLKEGRERCWAAVQKALREKPLYPNANRTSTARTVPPHHSQLT